MTESWDESLEAHRRRQRRVVFDATLSLVAEHGLSDVSMAEVARRAGIGRATLYKYFPSVEHILAAVALEEVTRERAALDQALAGVTDPLDRVRVSVRFLLDYFATDRHREASAVVSPHQLSPGVGKEVAAAFDELHQMLATMVREAVTGGLIAPEPGPEFAAEALNHLVAAGREVVVTGRMGPDEAADSVMALFLDGARGRLSGDRSRSSSGRG